MKLFAGLSTTDYQDVLRALGRVIDDHKLRDIRIWEHEEGLIVQGRPYGEVESGAFQTYLLTDDDLREILNEAYRRRGLPPVELNQIA
jgi:hypothetical protein